MPIMSGASFPGTHKVMLFIDGHYLAKNISEKTDGDINYDKLAKYLNTYARFDNHIGPIMIRAYYYDGKPDVRDAENLDEKKQEAKEKIENTLKIQDDELTKIRNTDLFDVRLGHAVITKNLEFRQKGVDLLLGIDMISKAYEGQYDVAVLVAGDSDFIELVQAVKHIGPRVIGAYFDHNVRKELTDSFDKRFELSVENLIANKIIEKK
ncbi:MAG: NYN domain-containing protein [Thaumarchaeota archaeon]|nr:NYN domain-containing protein [Nitrososphaerota archaeon]